MFQSKGFVRRTKVMAPLKIYTNAFKLLFTLRHRSRVFILQNKINFENVISTSKGKHIKKIKTTNN